MSGLAEQIRLALVDDAWEGHPNVLTSDDLAAIAETAARVLETTDASEHTTDAAVQALREASGAASQMPYPASPDPQDWATWLSARADALEAMAKS